jgi:peptidoglycan/LPS O-acetylase OafA/YrhL
VTWLDIVRILTAFLVLGIHWLRACDKVRLFGAQADDIFVRYQQLSTGLPFSQAFIIVSSFSLTVALANRSLSANQWIGWFRKRATRILIPFYLVALPFLVGYLALVRFFAGRHDALAIGLNGKLASLFHTPLPGIVLSHTLLFDPFRRHWEADFFAPAWWFVPAILLAYALFPLFFAAARRMNGVAALGIAAAVTMLSYHLAGNDVLLNQSWYFIVLQQAFNFMLGILAGRAWLDSRGPLLDAFFSNHWTLLWGFSAFTLGNIWNWSPTTRPAASILYGPGLVLILVSIAKRCEKQPFVRLVARIDSYGLYLVHQPLAFPIALAFSLALRPHAVFIGWFVFVVVASLGALLLSWLQSYNVIPKIFRRLEALVLRA